MHAIVLLNARVYEKKLQIIRKSNVVNNSFSFSTYKEFWGGKNGRIKTLIKIKLQVLEKSAFLQSYIIIYEITRLEL